MNKRKVAAIILAAGGSSRLGRPKQLLDWFGKPFVKQLVDLTKEAKLDPIIVVTGSDQEAIEKAINGSNATIIYNENWKNGQSSSMQAGCKFLETEQVDAFIVFLCDQPQVPVELIERMITESCKDELDIVATSVQGKVCPPTLFKKNCIEGIMSLQGDQGGRVLFKDYQTEILEWKDVRLIQDSDTEEDYIKLKSLFS